MPSYGIFNVGNQTGRPVRVSADGSPERKAGGITIDWTTVTAVSADTTLADGTFVPNGGKYLRYGQVVDLIGVAAEVQTVDLSGADDPNGGTWSLTVDMGRGSGPQTTAPVAWNVSAADLQTAVEALDGVSVGDVVVTKTGFVYTLTFAGTLGNVPAVSATNIDLTTAVTTVTIAVATGTGGAASGGLYGPADTSVSDGRQTLANGETFVLDETVVMTDPGSDHAGGAFNGGRVFAARLLVGGTNQVTLANLLAACPRLVLVKD
jgi:hypothetical protein